MRVVSVTRDEDTLESGALSGCHWTAELEWTLVCGVSVPLVGEKSFEQKATRVVHLTFGESEASQRAREVAFDDKGECSSGAIDRVPSSGSSSSQEHQKHSSWGSVASLRQPEVVLTKVK